MEAFETFEHHGYTCELHHDEEPSSPADWDQLGELVAFDSLWRDYRFAERNSTGAEDEALERGGWKVLARYLRMTRGAIAVPFYYADYGSGGARLWATDADDDNPSGFIYTTPERVRELCGDPVPPWDPALDPFYCPADWTGSPVEWIEEQLRGELKTWNDYVEGRVVGYVVRGADGDVLDSCWGFYPDTDGDGLDYVRGEAREAAEQFASEDANAFRYMAL